MLLFHALFRDCVHVNWMVIINRYNNGKVEIIDLPPRADAGRKGHLSEEVLFGDVLNN